MRIIADLIKNLKFSVWVIPILIILHAGAIIAEAVETKIGGQFRPRWESRDRDFNKATEPFEFTDFRLRLDFNTKLSNSLNTFFQVASEPVLGSAAPDQVRIHQAYFLNKDFLGLPVDVKLGRQEIVLDGHRIFGNNGWSQAGRTHDGAVISNKGDKYTLSFIYSKLTEQGNEVVGDSEDATAYALWYQLRDFIIPKQKLSLYFLYININTLKTIPVPTGFLLEDIDDVEIFIGGFRQAGRILGLDYRLELYYEFGQDEFRGLQPGGGTNINAFLFGARVGKSFRNIFLKPQITFWYDYVSGDDGQGDLEAFGSPFITTHKFYGFMDRFDTLNAQSRDAGDGFSNSALLGLQDLAVKTVFQPFKKVRFLADFHFFWTAEILALGGTGVADTTILGSKSLGRELDLTVVYQYNSFMNLIVGYSEFWPEPLIKAINADFGLDRARWAYAMVDIKF